jgi:hypothetical protein
MWLMPVAPGSTTGYGGVCNTIRTGPQASAFQRMTLGHLGEWGHTGMSFNQSTYQYAHGSQLINGTYYNNATYLGSSNAKYTMNCVVDSYTAANTSVQHSQTALNSSNLKGIEPIFHGGQLNSSGTASYDTNYTAPYAANPFPMMWALGRVRGLKFVGSPPSGTWSTLDTVSMTVDSNGFYVKTGGTATTFSLIGFAPMAYNADASYDPTLFYAIPA